MSSSIASFQPSSNVFSLLPPEVWRRILWSMDIETLFNMCKAAPDLTSLAFSATTMKIVRIDPETDFGTIQKFLEQTRVGVAFGNHVTVVSTSVDVRELHFTDCVALPPGVVIHCARSCCNIRKLHCVGCVVEPDKLFVFLSKTLHGLDKLEWSLH
ncbi:hypothetical protein MRX96_011177 [Rhipicephalus microplus]